MSSVTLIWQLDQNIYGILSFVKHSRGFETSSLFVTQPIINMSLALLSVIS